MTDNVYNLNEILTDWCVNVIKRIRENLDATHTTASGKTKESLEFELTDYGVIITARPFAKGVETGRPGGGIPRNMTDIISQWIIDKGIESHFEIETPSQLRSVAYLIGQKIKREGTELYREGGRTDIYTEPSQEELEKLYDLLFHKIGAEIYNKL